MPLGTPAALAAWTTSFGPSFIRETMSTKAVLIDFAMARRILTVP